MTDFVDLLLFHFRTKGGQAEKHFLKNEKGICFRVDSVDKVERGKDTREILFANYCYTIFYLFI